MTDECDYCIPESEIIAKEVGKIMTDSELVKLAEGIEVLGCVLKCGQERLTCLPLLRIGLEMQRRERDRA